MAQSHHLSLSALVLGSLAILPVATPAGADLIAIESVTSTEGLGSFTGSIGYTWDGFVGTLAISLTNTTDEELGGYMTGFLFNIEGDDASATLVDGPEGFTFTDGSGSPFGTFEAGAALRSSFLGRGSPAGGIAVGESGAFTFHITGADAPLLGAASFIAGELSFVVRFRGLSGDESDKAVGEVAGTPIPLPPAMALGLAGLVVVAIRRRRT